MSLIALIATSVSAYAVSSSIFAAGVSDLACLKHLNSRHLGHPLVRGDQGDGLVTEVEPAEHAQGFRSRGGADDAYSAPYCVTRSLVIAAKPADRHRRSGLSDGSSDFSWVAQANGL
jgi:hypothetical protein